MPVQQSCAGISAPAKADIKIWDTQYVCPSKAFSIYREALCKVYMPWSPECKNAGEFLARVEAVMMPEGSIARHRCSAHSAVRTRADIANSPTECVYVVYVLSGRHKCEQDGRTNIAAAGDILVVDSALPVKVTTELDRHDIVVFTVPKSGLGAVTDDRFANFLLTQNRSPLASCLALAAERIIAASSEELKSLYDACLSLLPLEAGCYDSASSEESARSKARHLLKDILDHVDRNVARPELSPQDVADHFGISIRYVHKLFLDCGTTFCAYVKARRLEYIRRDLMSSSARHQPISLVAYRWGFNDLSSFNRAFKVRYGCTPSHFRANASC